MFNQPSTHQDSLRFVTEADFFKQNLTAKYLQQHAPVMDRPLKETSPTSLEKYLRECIKYGMVNGLHYKLWYILETAPTLKHTQTLSRERLQHTLGIIKS